MGKKLLGILLGTLLLVGCSNAFEPGDYYSRNGIKGFVLNTDNEGNPLLLLSVDEIANIDADSASKWARNYDDGSWHLPTKEETAQMKKFKALINKTAERKKLPQVLVGHTFYWTGTACSESHTYACGPDGIRCYFNSNASGHYRARAVKELKQ